MLFENPVTPRRLPYLSPRVSIVFSVAETSVMSDNDESTPLHGGQLLCHYH